MPTKARRTVALALCVMCSCVLLQCSGPDTVGEDGAVAVYKGKPYLGTLATIREKGFVRIITPGKEFAALPRSGNVLSFEQDVARAHAARLGVKPSYVYVESYDSIIPWLAGGRADVAVASLTATEERRQQVDFSTPLGHVREMLVGKAADTSRYRSISDLDSATIAVRASSSYYQTLLALKDSLPNLTIQTVPENLHTHEILHKVAKGALPLTVCDSDIAEGVLAYEKGLAVLMPLTEYRDICWAVAKGCDSLLSELNGFIREQELAGHRLERFTGDLDSMKARRTLRVATRNNAATYWIYRGKEVGFEYELARAFAHEHDLRLEMVLAPDRASLLDWVDQGKADIAAACLTITEERQGTVAFGSPYLFPAEVLVCGVDSAGGPAIKDKAELPGIAIHVRRSSSYHGTLKLLEAELDTVLQIHEVPEEIETEEILRKVAEGEYQATVADDYLADMEMTYAEDLAIAFPLTEKREVGWAMRTDNPELKQAVNAFFGSGAYKPRSLKYNILYRRYFKSSRTARRALSDERADLHGTISPYDNLMKKYASARGFDWRMVAAQVYQESKFNPRARSWVGAQGLMQIMPATARELGLTDPADPAQSLRGGTTYMDRMLDRFDKGIPYRERYHFALASYNAGYGHVLDARQLAEEQGLDPNQWFGNVEQAMLLLSKPTYARQARYGYVRGTEPVTYVGNIQRLYNHYSQID